VVQIPFLALFNPAEFEGFYETELVSYITPLTDRIVLEGEIMAWFRGKGGASQVRCSAQNQMP